MKKCVGLLACVALSACASTETLYDWGNYQGALVNYTKNSDEAAFEAELRDAIAEGEANGKVAPGLYAELGYLLFNQGNRAEAVEYFQREQSTFPESMILMTTLIGSIQSQTEGDTQ